MGLLYNVDLNLEDMTAEAVVNRTGMFNVNVVQFLNANPAGITFPVSQLMYNRLIST